LVQLAGVFLAKVHAQHDADAGDTREEDDKRRRVFARDSSGAEEDVADDDIQEPQRTFTVAEDKPFPGGFENGDGKRSPETPWT
jgi:hypothetical protein